MRRFELLFILFLVTKILEIYLLKKRKKLDDEFLYDKS
jgi:hypothetical protein